MIMGRRIHTRKEGDEIWYRCWSTIIDDYVTEETQDPDELRDLLLADALKRAEEDFLMYWPRRIENAEKYGTSCLGRARSTDEWDKSMAQRVADGEFDDEED